MIHTGLCKCVNISDCSVTRICILSCDIRYLSKRTDSNFHVGQILAIGYRHVADMVSSTLNLKESKFIVECLGSCNIFKSLCKLQYDILHFVYTAWLCATSTSKNLYLSIWFWLFRHIPWEYSWPQSPLHLLSCDLFPARFIYERNQRPSFLRIHFDVSRNQITTSAIESTPSFFLASISCEAIRWWECPNTVIANSYLKPTISCSCFAGDSCYIINLSLWLIIWII